MPTIVGLASERKNAHASDREPPSRRLLVVAGKGGVGRSSVAAGLALAAANRGDRVLAIDGTSDGGLERALGRHNSSAGGPVDRVELSTQEALEEYLDLHLAVPIPGLRVGPIASAFDFLAVAAPGVREILAMGKVCNEVRKGPYDLVVLDAPATGHVVELLASPDTLSELIPVGPLTRQTAWMRTLLASDDSSVVLVTVAEDLPVTETLSLAARIKEETTIQLQAVVANRLPVDLGPAGTREAKNLAATTSPLGVAAQMALDRIERAGDSLTPIDSLGLPLVRVETSDETDHSIAGHSIADHSIADHSIADHIAPAVAELI